MKKLKNKIPHELGIGKINLQQKTYNSREKMSENAVSGFATIDHRLSRIKSNVLYEFFFFRQEFLDYSMKKDLQ